VSPIRVKKMQLYVQNNTYRTTNRYCHSWNVPKHNFISVKSEQRKQIILDAHFFTMKAVYKKILCEF
jgi:hypothetical protein